MRFPEAPGSHISPYRRGKFTVISIRKKHGVSRAFSLFFRLFLAAGFQLLRRNGPALGHVAVHRDLRTMTFNSAGFFTRMGPVS